jgi:type IV secretory pathway VirJ component
MKKTISICIGLLILGLKAHATPVDTMLYNTFGKVIIYQPANIPDAFVLFVSGDGGWNEGVVDMAKNITAQGALVAGIDITHYFNSIKSSKAKCYYPAADFEELSLTIQKRYKLDQYNKPILVGYSSGATLIYGILAQAPANTFKGAISLGFCPDIQINKPLCSGSGLKSHVLEEGKSFYLEACSTLTAPFIVLQGMIDEVCSYVDTKKYLENLPLCELITLQHVGHGFSVAKNWLPQLISAYQRVLKAPDYVNKINTQNKVLQQQSLTPLNSDFTLSLIPSASKENLPLVFFISGDGGWTSFDHTVGEKLAENGMSVVGLNAQKYFWNEKQPKEASDEIARAVVHYMQQWNKNSFILVGYSFGACVAPFIVNNFPGALKERLKGIYCLSPSETGDFEIHVSDMLHLENIAKYDVLKELIKVESLKPVCIFATEEDIKLRNHFSVTGIRVETLPGDHHYNNDFNSIAAIIYKDFTPRN